MAVWNPLNIVLTDLGEEILSKVQVGNGAITISKIEAGGSFTTPANLKALTTVNNAKQNLSILSSNTYTGGSNLELLLSNTGLLSSYTLYQIGIYVTHPDYVGDILYLIAQCDETGADVIPVPADNNIIMNFSLLMSHSGTTNVAITVSPSGVLTTASIGVYIPAIGSVLTRTNTTSYTPSGEYNPATKKYVDDLISVGTVQPPRGLWFKEITI